MKCNLIFIWIIILLIVIYLFAVKYKIEDLYYKYNQLQIEKLKED